MLGYSINQIIREKNWKKRNQEFKKNKKFKIKNNFQKNNLKIERTSYHLKTLQRATGGEN
uniref:Uncharacterized protein n=1 Tax=Methanococcus maripaludis TaxID=39152 RepID=Q9V2U0_METMI|nr:hypothetical protein [Methanococcus maripaludis]